MKDFENVSKARKGDREAFGRLYDAYMPAIYRFVLLKVGHKADAEDLTHQVFLSAWKNIPSYEHQGHPFSSWLYRIAHNAVIDHYRTARRHLDVDSISEEVVAIAPEMGAAVDAAAEARVVQAALRMLDHDYQTVLTMRYVNELTTKEIAAALDKSEGAVRVMQHRALKQLKKQIDEQQGNTHASQTA